MGIKDGKKSFVSFFDMQVVKLAITIYFVVITAIISNYTSKEFYELLWPNERVAIVIFMTVSLLVPYFYMQYIKKQDGFKTLIIYHMVMIFAALVMIMPYEFRPYVAIAIVVAYFTDFSTGVAVNAGICGFGFFSLASEPEFFFAIVMLLMGTCGCFVVEKFRSIITKYIIQVLLLVFCFALHMSFRIYCEEVYPEYETVAFAFKSCIGVVISLVIYNVVDIVYKMFFTCSASKTVLKNMTKDTYKPLKLLKTKGINIYYHSKEVAELSLGAAKALNENKDLAYVGALYHDIGKLVSKDYVNDGVGIAKKHNMPKEVISIIKHHNVKFGTPTNKVEAIVMLADSVVGAINYMKSKDDNNVSVELIIDNAMTKRLMEGALDKSTLTIDEFSRIKESFIATKEM